MMRCCVPLDSVIITGISDYHGFASLVGLDIALGKSQPVSWYPGNITQGDLAGGAGDRVRRQSTGPSTPSKSFSFKSAIPFLKSNSPKPSRDTSPTRTPSEAHGPMYIDTTFPPWLASALANSVKENPTVYEEDQPSTNSFTFNVAVLNEKAWFAEALQAAVETSAGRRYKTGVTRPSMVLNVGGHDCLATDEELESSGGEVSQVSTRSSEDLDEEKEDKFVSETRKAEKAAMAAKVFGLKEEEPIWRELFLLC